MGGIFVDDGGSLRIVGLRLTLEEGVPSVEHQGIQLATEMWMHWMHIGLEHLDVAERSRTELLAALQSGDDDAKGKALSAETRAGMVAVASAGFAIDAFYASTLERVAVPDTIRQAWRDNRTARPARVIEVVKLAYAIKAEPMQHFPQGIKEVYKFRDWAVHPSAEFRQVYLHPVIQQGVEWRHIAFSSDNAYKALAIAQTLLKLALENPRPRHTALVEWAGKARRLVPERGTSPAAVQM
jgi:hypothetical protein